MSAGVGCAFAFVGALHCGARTSSLAQVPESEFADRFAAARCALADDCCLGAGYGAASDACIPEERNKAEQDMAAARVAGAVYDPIAGAACIEGYATSCDALRALKNVGNRPPVCARVYAGGIVAIGNPCTVDWACRGHASLDVRCALDVVNGDFVGSCREEAAGATPGAACLPAKGSGAPFCIAPLVCDASRCRAPSLGEPCDGGAADDCAPGTMCDRASSTCVAPTHHPGDACAADDECEGYHCDLGRCLSPGSLAGPNSCMPHPVSSSG